MHGGAILKLIQLRRDRERMEQTAVQDNTTNLKKLIASVTMTALFIQ